MQTITATYSPDDNKLRITAALRLDADTYARVKAAGFAWAPKQEQFIAPMWTPGRADLCIELAGQIDDDDGSLQERAEDRAERFDQYSAKRGVESARALDHVHQITAGIPLGQPILVGHHSQRHAERDAKRIENGMRRAVDLFDTAEYWKRRAAAALAHADYKERADVRHRRIKGLESDQRKHQKDHDAAEHFSRLWDTAISGGAGWKAERADGTPTDARSRCLTLANLSGAGSCGYGTWSALDSEKITLEQAREDGMKHCARVQAWAARWLQHIGNRLAYERAMLGEAGGLASDRFDIQPGGLVLIGSAWLPVVRLNKSGGQVVSVTTMGRYVPVRGIEEVKDYRPPSEEAAAAVEKIAKPAPLTNYPGQGFVHVTRAQWDGISKDYKGTRDMGAGIDATRGGTRHDTLKGYRAGSDEFQRHRVRVAMGTSLRHAIGAEAFAVLFPATDGTERANIGHGLHPVFIVDAKTTPPAKVGEVKKARGVAGAAPWNKDREPDTEQASPAAVLRAEVERAGPAPARAPRATHSQPLATHSDVEAVRAALKTGVKAVAAPQLFPTPPDLAARMVELANVEPGAYVLEPSAGTGRIVDAMRGDDRIKHITAVEVNHALSDGVRARVDRLAVGDFLACSAATLGSHFHAIVMNPPFAKGQDVAHVTHALQFLAPGCRLVAIMSAGVTFRQDRKTAAFRDLVSQMGGTIEALPAGTFESSGTGVNTVLVVLDAPDAKLAPAPVDSLDEIKVAQVAEFMANGCSTAYEAMGEQIKARSHFSTAGRVFAVLAEFPDTEAGTRAANSYMETNPGAAVLAVDGGRIILADKTDDGTGVVQLPELEPAPDYSGADTLQAQALEIAWNVTRKRIEWSSHGVPTAAELRGAASSLEAMAASMDESGGRLAQAYRAAAQIVQGHATAADCAKADEEAQALGHADAQAGREHDAWLQANGTPEFKAWRAELAGPLPTHS